MSETPLPTSPETTTTARLNRTTLGVSFASLLSDVSHEMATAVPPAFLITLGAGPAAALQLASALRIVSGNPPSKGD